MASNFPSSLDTFTNPSSSDAMDSVSVPHATQHSDLNDAVEALQTKVGADSSGVASSHDYKIAQLEALGEYTDYSGSITFINWTLGNGTVNARYTQINKFVHYWGTITIGSTTSVGTYAAISLPVNANATAPANSFRGTTYYDQPGVQNSVGGIGLSSAAVAYFQAWVASGSYSSVVGLGSAVPFTWATGDSIFWSFMYEAA